MSDALTERDASPAATAARPAAARPAPGAGPILEARDVRKTYRMGRVDVPVLQGASISVAEGEFVAVLGASGSGKSTLMHLLADLDRPDARGGGEIVFRGERIDTLSGRRRNRYRNHSIGIVFQFYHLLPELNVLENAVLPAMIGRGRFAWMQGRTAARARAREILESFGLGHRLGHRPSELSGGERQRVAIARALVNGPDVLLADEPTGNLDARTGGEILQLLEARHAAGLTIIMVTHDRSIAERADRTVELREGRVRLADPD
jgi:lipoprotein-releasing system ATP-binding protein